MKEESARVLLNKIMGWSKPGEAAEEHPSLQALAIFGYDDYQQFAPAMRFIESLAIWLNRFPSEHRKAAYGFIRNRLLFITRSQMEHIVLNSYQDHIVPILLKTASEESKIPEWHISKLSQSKEFKTLHNRCLFLGLSDGSHIDVFRRSNQNINHEQVFRTHEINERRKESMLRKLKNRLQVISEKSPTNFKMVFLLDDFSASGRSYLIEDPKELNGIGGKIANFLNAIKDTNDPISKLVNIDDLKVYVILYVATETAISHIQELGNKAFGKIPFSVIGIQIIPDSIKFDPAADSEFFELVKQDKYGWENLVDAHYQQGKTEKPYLGFDEGGLPLILYHNTPNNSLPILHRNDSNTLFKGLFPRVSRHH